MTIETCLSDVKKPIYCVQRSVARSRLSAVYTFHVIDDGKILTVTRPVRVFGCGLNRPARYMADWAQRLGLSLEAVSSLAGGDRIIEL